MKAAHNKGIIVVVAAGNDGCNTANFSPTRIPEVFVVGATRQDLILQSKDAKRASSRTGWNISTFAPGENVRLKNQNGSNVTASGTSFSAPYISGIFAIACQAAGQLCNTATSAAPLYQTLRNTGTLGTVTNTDGSPLSGATSRFIRQQW
jgi:subtilisin family serine protease